MGLRRAGKGYVLGVGADHNLALGRRAAGSGRGGGDRPRSRPIRLETSVGWRSNQERSAP
jgi:hypothetical protein